MHKAYKHTHMSRSCAKCCALGMRAAFGLLHMHPTQIIAPIVYSDL